MLYSKYGHSSAHDYVIMTTTSFLETATFCSLSIPDLLWQIFDRLLLNCRKMRETDTDCSYGKRKKGKVDRFCVIVAAIICFQAMRTMLPCVMNSDFSPKLHCWQNGCHFRSQRAPILGMAMKLGPKQESGHPREEKNG